MRHVYFRALREPLDLRDPRDLRADLDLRDPRDLWDAPPFLNLAAFSLRGAGTSSADRIL